jgi:hypothetical protein
MRDEAAGTASRSRILCGTCAHFVPASAKFCANRPNLRAPSARAAEMPPSTRPYALLMAHVHLCARISLSDGRREVVKRVRRMGGGSEDARQLIIARTIALRVGANKGKK